MDKITAQSATKKLNTEIFSLSPSTLVTLFEIDITDILFDTGYISVADKLNNPNSVFRFHNTIKFIETSIFWNNQEYFPMPINAEGFETSGGGVSPTPTLTLTVNDEGISALGQLKSQILRMGDLVGAKVTRIRTFAKYLDAKNYFTQTIEESTPDPNVEFGRDIYYIERKALENKFTIQYELSSIWDLEGIKLPRRMVISNKCSWRYRGEGCLYEASSRRNNSEHGATATLPTVAPAVANELDEDLTKVVGVSAIIDKGLWELGKTYTKGDSVFIKKGNINYYYVAKQDNPPIGPPNLLYWANDTCSQLLNGCKKRWNNIGNGYLPFGGFPSVNKFS